MEVMSPKFDKLSWRDETAIPNSQIQTTEFIIIKVLSAVTITENDKIVAMVGHGDL